MGTGHICGDRGTRQDSSAWTPRRVGVKVQTWIAVMPLPGPSQTMRWCGWACLPVQLTSRPSTSHPNVDPTRSRPTAAALDPPHRDSGGSRQQRPRCRRDRPATVRRTLQQPAHHRAARQGRDTTHRGQRTERSPRWRSPASASARPSSARPAPPRRSAPRAPATRRPARSPPPRRPVRQPRSHWSRPTAHRGAGPWPISNGASTTWTEASANNQPSARIASGHRLAG